MKLRASLLAVTASLIAVLVLAPVAPAATASQAASSTSALSTPVTGTITSAVGGALNGVFTITGISQQNGQLVANGTLTGTLTDAAGAVIGTVNQTIAVPLQATGSCPVLHLDLGPLDLNLLGLQVHLNEVVLDITAQAGPGNLLGNLLCAVTHLLDNPSGTLNGVVNLLNNILARL